MSDCTCPHCGEEFDVYDTPADEGREHEYECPSCRRKLVLTCSINVDWEAYCNEGQHDLERSEEYPTMSNCTRCGYYEDSRLKGRQ